MKSSHYVGVSFYRGQIQLAEIDHGKKKTVTALSERTTAIKFAQDTSFSASHPQLFTFVYELEELLKQNKVHAKTISFALPIEPLFIQVIPLDATLQGNEMASHLSWEFEQFYPDVPAKEFIINAYPIPGTDKKTKQVFLVGVRRGLVGFLKRAATELRLQVHLVDIDHFSAEKALRHCHPELLKDNLILIGNRGDALDVSLVSQGNYIDYRAYRLSHTEDLKKSVIAFRQYLEQKYGSASPNKIVLYGFDISPQTLHSIQRETGASAVALDTLRHLEPSKKLDKDLVKDNARFAAAIGLALRTQ
jgi:Tfp pilus assembly PilM family ATPase